MRYFLLILLLIGPVHASAYKCTDSEGKVSFQETKCIGTDEVKVNVKTQKSEDYEYSMWVEPNFVDTQYSVLFRGVNIYEHKKGDIVYKNVPWGWKSYKATGEVIEIFKGDFSIGETLDVIVYLPYNSRQVKSLNEDYLLSFCKSKSGKYFIGTQYQLQKATAGNIRKFRDVKKNGTSHQGDEKCIYNNPSFNPDTHN